MVITKPPTIREVAREAGVSAMTVSRVLTGRGYVAEQTATRVRAAFEQLQYRPNSAARLLRGRRSHLVGVTIPSLASAVHRGIVAGLEEVLGAAEYQLLLGHLQAGARQSASFLESVQRQHCDGYVIVPSRADAEIVAPPPLDRPAVVALSSIPGLTTDRVLTDGEHAVVDATRYLLERFGGPVGFVSLDSKVSHDLSMLNGYREAVRAAGEEERLLLMPIGAGDCRAGVRALLAQARPPRAFVMASSQVVFDGIGQLVQAGLTIGEDVGVVSVAGEERQWTALLPRRLPLLLIPSREIGRRSGELLLRRLSEDESSEPETIVIPTRFEPEPPPTRE